MSSPIQRRHFTFFWLWTMVSNLEVLILILTASHLSMNWSNERLRSYSRDQGAHRRGPRLPIIMAKPPHRIPQGTWLNAFLSSTKHVGSIHLSILHRLSGVGLQGQQPKQGSPDFPLPSYFIQLFRGDPKAFPGQPRDIVRLSTGETCPDTSSGRRPEGILTRCPNHHHLTPLGAEKQRLYSEVIW